MGEEQLNELLESIQSKIEPTAYALISEELLGIKSGVTTLISDMSQKDDNINEMKKTQEELLLTNGRLMQKISFENEKKTTYNNANNTNNDDGEKKDEIIHISDFINEKGEFINAK